MYTKGILWILALALLGGGIWYAFQANWFRDAGPTNPPTAEEMERIRAIETSSAERAPNARPGVGVAAPGTLPQEPQPEAETASGTDETLE